jgi:hypothetical protein
VTCARSSGWGDDPYSDDLLARPYLQYGSGGYIHFAVCVNKGTLNEDWGQDEIYVGVRVHNPVTNQQLDKAENEPDHQLLLTE